MLSCEKAVQYCNEEHYCPHCDTRLSCCETPPFHIGDGLGWGSEVMFICLNDECPVFANGWKQVDEVYGHSGTFRYMKLPDQTKGEIMMVGSGMAFTGSIVDPEKIKSQNKRYLAEKEATTKLETCVADKDISPAIYLITDEHAKVSSRKKACDLLVDLNDLACIDPIRNYSFRNTDVEQRANMAIIALLAANFKKECPVCAEIIKKQAKICQFCQKELN